MQDVIGMSAIEQQIKPNATGRRAERRALADYASAKR